MFVEAINKVALSNANAYLLKASLIGMYLCHKLEIHLLSIL